MKPDMVTRLWTVHVPLTSYNMGCGNKRTSGRSQPASLAHMVSNKTPYLNQGRQSVQSNTQGCSVVLTHVLWYRVLPYSYTQTGISPFRAVPAVYSEALGPHNEPWNVSKLTVSINSLSTFLPEFILPTLKCYTNS